jgi:superfamily II DNA/RNA helicase
MVDTIGCHTQQVLPNDGAKLPWLKLKLPEFIDAGDVLVFVNQKTKVEELTQSLVASGFRCRLAYQNPLT